MSTGALFGFLFFVRPLLCGSCVWLTVPNDQSCSDRGVGCERGHSEIVACAERNVHRQSFCVFHRGQSQGLQSDSQPQNTIICRTVSPPHSRSTSRLDLIAGKRTKMAYCLHLSLPSIMSPCRIAVSMFIKTIFSGTLGASPPSLVGLMTYTVSCSLLQSSCLRNYGL